MRGLSLPLCTEHCVFVQGLPRQTGARRRPASTLVVRHRRTLVGHDSLHGIGSHNGHSSPFSDTYKVILIVFVVFDENISIYQHQGLVLRESLSYCHHRNQRCIFHFFDSFRPKMVSFAFSKASSVCIMLLMTIALASAKTRRGTASAYAEPFKMDKNGKNVCEFSSGSLDKRWQSFFVALHEKDFQDAEGACDKCVRVKGGAANGSNARKFDSNIYAKIVDTCQGDNCLEGSLSISTSTMKAITGDSSWDEAEIAWEIVDCPAASNLRGGRKMKRGF